MDCTIQIDEVSSSRRRRTIKWPFGRRPPRHHARPHRVHRPLRRSRAPNERRLLPIGSLRPL